MIDEPLREREPGPGFTVDVAVVVGAPLRTPAGMEKHRVTGLDRVPARRERGLRVVRRDDVALRERGHATGGGDVQEQPSCHHLRQRLDAKAIRAVLLDNVGEAMPVVGAVADLQMIQAVHVRAHLRRRADVLDDPVHAIVTETVRSCVRCARVQVMGGCREVLPERTPREGRNVFVEHVCEVIGHALANERGSAHDASGRDLVEGFNFDGHHVVAVALDS